MQKKALLTGTIIGLLVFAQLTSMPLQAGFWGNYRKLYRMSHPRDGHLFFGFLDRITPFIPTNILTSLLNNSKGVEDGNRGVSNDATHNKLDAEKKAIQNIAAGLANNPPPWKVEDVSGAGILPTPPSGKGIALTVGLNHFSPTTYGTGADLNGCENDANAMFRLAASQGFECRGPLLSQAATHKAVTDAIKQAANDVPDGGMFLLHVSSHGSQVADTSGDEADELDETWCLYDEMLLDDELPELWNLFKPNVRVVVLLDLCHSGTGIKAIDVKKGIEAKSKSLKSRGLRAVSPPVGPAGILLRNLPKNAHDRNVAQKTAVYKTREQAGDDDDRIKVPVLLVPGCQDNQFSGDTPTNGVFTGALLGIWSQASKPANYTELTTSLNAQMPSSQRSVLYPIGPATLTSALANEVPFTP